MKARKWLLSSMLAAGLTCAGVAVAQGPGVDIDRARHGNLAEAQEHIQQAYTKVVTAQQVNHEQLGGHAENAKHLLMQASQELKAAAEYADHHHR